MAQTTAESVFIISNPLKCPRCSSQAVGKRGNGRAGRLMWLCKNCGRRFVENPTLPKLHGKDNEIIRAYLSGKSTPVIARELGVNDATIWYHLNKNGIASRPRRLAASANTNIGGFELGWVVGIFDGEGSVGLYPNKKERPTSGLHVAFQIVNTNLDILRQVRRILGCGSLYGRQMPKKLTQSPVYSFHIYRQGDIAVVLKQMIPFLIEKREKAQNAIVFLEKGGDWNAQ